MGYRIAINLTKYFTDVRSYCYLHLDHKYEIVSNLEDYLRNLFGIEGPFCLLNNNFYLPNEENINIIKDGETISVIPIQNDWRQKKVNGERSDERQEQNENVIEDSATTKSNKKNKKKKNKEKVEKKVENGDMCQEKGKEKITIDEMNSTILPVNEDDNKEAMDVSVNSHDDCQENISTKNTELCDSNYEARSQSSHDTHPDDIDGLDSILLLEESTEMSTTLPLSVDRVMTMFNNNGTKLVAGVSVGRINKRKRIRKRKKKNHSLPIPTTDVSETTGNLQSTLSSLKKSINHIRFSDCEQPQAIVQNEGYSREQPEKPRVILALESDTDITKGSICSSSAVSSQSLYDQVHCSAEGISEDTKPKYVQDTSSEQVDLSSGVDETFKLTVDAVTKDLKSFPPIGSSLPVPKDIILFKMLKMDINYTPTISDYILAHVIDIEESNSIIKLSIIDGYIHCTSPKGKFNIMEDGESEGVVGCVALERREQMVVEVEWGRVVEARLVFP